MFVTGRVGMLAHQKVSNVGLASPPYVQAQPTFNLPESILSNIDKSRGRL